MVENTNQKTMTMSEITELPDGSGFFTADVMSKDEAMKLPPEKRPICFRISSEMYHAVFEAIGSASLCWKPRPGKEVFASDEASRIAVDLCFKIAAELERTQQEREDMLRLLRAAYLSISSHHQPQPTNAAGECKVCCSGPGCETFKRLHALQFNL